MVKALPSWDVKAINLVVRDRLYLTQDAVDRLMREERDIEVLCKGCDREAILELAQRAEKVRELGGDPSSLLAARDLLASELAAHEPKLIEVQAKLETARANMKWLDMAQSGLHWACFTDPKFQQMIDESQP